MSASPYTDLDRPPLPVRALERALVVPAGLWRRIDLRAETGSTNADAAAAARAGEPEGLVVIAESQRDGRGRRDRQWLSPPRAGLTFSVLLRPGVADPARGWAAVPNRRYGWLPLLAGVAVLDTLRRLAEVDATLKWPNDVLIQAAEQPAVESQMDQSAIEPQMDQAAIQPQMDQAAIESHRDQRSVEAGPSAKCAGILAEVVDNAVVIGVGLNVTTRSDELPTTDGPPATSLRLAGARSTDRDPLLRAVLRGLAGWYAGWRDTGGDAELSGLLAAYRQGCSTVGRQVRVSLPSGAELVGLATTVDADGQLVVQTADGERRVAAGDVRHVR